MGSWPRAPVLQERTRVHAKCMKSMCYTRIMRIKLGADVRIDGDSLEVDGGLLVRFVDPSSHSGGREWRLHLSEHHFQILEGTESGGGEVESGRVDADSVVIDSDGVPPSDRASTHGHGRETGLSGPRSKGEAVGR